MRCLKGIIAFLLLGVQIGLAAPQFLTISDIHYGKDNVSKEGKDTGPEWLKITLERLKVLSAQADFIINLGDLPTHNLFFRTKKEEYEATVFHGLYEADSTLKPLFYVTGNNDSLTGNYQPFETQGTSPLTFAKDWQGACAHCKGLMLDDSMMYSAGYYSSYVIPNNKDILLIALNTVQWTLLPPFAMPYPHQDEDAMQQLAWFEKQLQSHKAKQLIIAMHVPPGMNYLGFPLWHEAYLKQFIHLLNQYHSLYDEISLLAGHTHMDEIRKIQLSDGTSLFIYVTPGISRIHGNNPGMKLFQLNAQYLITNFTTYFSSHTTQWNNEAYQAMGASESIFPNCQHKILAKCLNSMSKDTVCNAIQTGLFYGVKNPNVSNKSCFNTYLVND